MHYCVLNSQFNLTHWSETYQIHTVIIRLLPLSGITMVKNEQIQMNGTTQNMKTITQMLNSYLVSIVLGLNIKYHGHLNHIDNVRMNKRK
jgi:hypothetical protein